MGFYDGMLGPGTGSFLVLAFTMVAHMPTLKATSMTKVVNAGTNLGALIFFASQEAIQWKLGAMRAVANMLGGWLGTRTATHLGPRFVRAVLIAVVIALIGRLSFQMFA